MITVDVSAWQTMQSLLDWQHATQSGDFAGLSMLMAQVITAWDYAPAPSDPASYAQLTPSQWAQCIREVSNAIGAMFR